MALHVYSLKMSLESGAQQPELIQYFKSHGDDVIQTSDGLCLKTNMTKDEVSAFLLDKNVQGITVSEVDRKGDLSKDVQAFLN